jgi:hypothetical protein
MKKHGSKNAVEIVSSILPGLRRLTSLFWITDLAEYEEKILFF